MQGQGESMALLQVLRKKQQPSNEATIQVQVRNKLVLKEKEWECKFCSGVLTEQSICSECKKPVDLVCLFCGKEEFYDTHEFCYCQLELLIPQTREEYSCHC